MGTFLYGVYYVSWITMQNVSFDTKISTLKPQYNRLSMEEQFNTFAISIIPIDHLSYTCVQVTLFSTKYQSFPL